MPRAKEDIQPPAPTAVPRSPEPPIQNTFIGRTPLAVFGRNAVTGSLNSPDLQLSYVHHLITPSLDPALKLLSIFSVTRSLRSAQAVRITPRLQRCASSPTTI